MEEKKQEQMKFAQKGDRLLAVLTYLSFLLFIPLLRKKKSEFLAYHVNQGLVLFVLEFCLNVAFAIIALVLNFAAPVLCAAVCSILGIIDFAFLICHVFGIIHVARGEMKKIPFLGEIKLYHPENQPQD